MSPQMKWGDLCEFLKQLQSKVVYSNVCYTVNLKIEALSFSTHKMLQKWICGISVSQSEFKEITYFLLKIKLNTCLGTMGKSVQTC